MDMFTSNLKLPEKGSFQKWLDDTEQPTTPLKKNSSWGLLGTPWVGGERDTQSIKSLKRHTKRQRIKEHTYEKLAAMPAVAVGYIIKDGDNG